MILKDVALLDFGAFPGKTYVEQDVTGQADIPSDATVDAWLSPVDTVDHSAHEHMVDPPDVFAGNVVASVGFTIYGTARNGRLWGKYTVNWVWST